MLCSLCGRCLLPWANVIYVYVNTYRCIYMYIYLIYHINDIYTHAVLSFSKHVKVKYYDFYRSF
jgi:hypothetical protein